MISLLYFIACVVCYCDGYEMVATGCLICSALYDVYDAIKEVRKNA